MQGLVLWLGITFSDTGIYVQLEATKILMLGKYSTLLC